MGGDAAHTGYPRSTPLLVPVVQEHDAEDEEGCHAGEGGGVVRVGGHQEALELVVLEVAHLDLHTRKTTVLHPTQMNRYNLPWREPNHLDNLAN